MTHRVELGGDARGNLTRIENTLAQMPERLENVKNQLENLHRQQDAARAEPRRSPRLKFICPKSRQVKLDDRLYQIKLRYDKNDEIELLIQVLSFGPVLEVKAPTGFIQLMRNRIQKQTDYAPRARKE